MTSAADYAERALRAHAAMERRFRRHDGLYRRPGWLGRVGAAEHLWPVARAFAATLDVAGIPTELAADFDADAAITRDLRGLERYWDQRGPCPGYASDLHRSPWGGDRYYDDNAWVGLTLIQLERLRPGRSPTGRAAQLFEFARAGWCPDVNVGHPGGTFWVEQGRGAGRRNHDRNTVSNAPNAELGLHLDELESSERRRSDAWRMWDWVQHALRTPEDLYFDKLRGDGTIDRALWSYNQGSMAGAAVLRYRASAAAEFLRAAEVITQAALHRYAGRYLDQAPAFNAIFFRNLLLLHTVSGDPDLRVRIGTEMSAYADQIWDQRQRNDLFTRADGQLALLDQSALVSVLALLAWEPKDYARLA